MAEFTLYARPALGGYAREWPGAKLVEIERTLVSVAARAGAARGLELHGEALPAPGTFSETGGIATYWIGQGQWFVASDETALFERLRKAWGAAPSLTEQTDAWVQLRLSGPGAMAALERLCPIDLGAFPPGSAARTAMEHLGVVIAREEDGFLLMSTRSSARSFLHALETALDSVLG